MSDDVPAVNRGGRPPLPEGERLDAEFRFRAKNAQYDYAARRSFQLRMSVGAFMLRLLDEDRRREAEKKAASRL